MGFPPGGNIVQTRLKELEEAIDNYFGMINQIRNGIKVPQDEVVEEPEALLLYDMCKEMGIPRVAGSLEEQPFIWLQEWAVAKQRSELHEALWQASRPKLPDSNGAQ